LIPLVVLAFPALWINPLGEIFAGMRFVGWYYQPGCTLTWGQCMPAYATPSYLLGWFVVKAPLIIFAGIAVVPLALKRLWRARFQRVAYADPFFLYRPFLRSQACVEPLENITGIPTEGLAVAITCSPNRIKVPASCQPLSAI